METERGRRRSRAIPGRISRLNCRYISRIVPAVKPGAMRTLDGAPLQYAKRGLRKDDLHLWLSARCRAKQPGQLRVVEGDGSVRGWIET